MSISFFKDSGDTPGGYAALIGISAFSLIVLVGFAASLCLCVALTKCADRNENMNDEEIEHYNEIQPILD